MARKGMTILGVSFSLMLVNPVSGHVNLLYPVGGESFEYGEKVNVQWEIEIEHAQNNWDLFLSPDGGTNWEVIVLDLSVDKTAYGWTVPESMTEQGRIRILQDNVGANYDDVSGDFTIQDPQASVHVPTELPQRPRLYENIPNPFNPVTDLRFDLPQRAYVTLTVYDILGRKVKTLVEGIQEPGSRSITWDGTDDREEGVSTGVYLYRIRVGDRFTQTRRMILLR